MTATDTPPTAALSVPVRNSQLVTRNSSLLLFQQVSKWYGPVLAGDRLVLLITGHHRPGEAPVQRGKIRAAVHDWLAVSRHAPQIAAVRSAHRRHGGGGSLYLVLRR